MRRSTLQIFILTAAMALIGALPAIASAKTGTKAAGRSVKLETALYDFDYSYPAAAAAIPGLRTRLDADLARSLAKLKRDAAEAKADSRKDKYVFNKWYWSQAWQVVVSTPRWLSLSAAYENYSGGAHGMHWSGTMLWDKAANLPRDPFSLFTSKQALSAAIKGEFCDVLDKQRAEKRGEPVNRASGDEFDACIDPTGETVILGSASHQVFDRIGILVAPYEAGPYVEGSYEVTLPVTAAVLAAVRPEFRSSFAIPR